MTTILFTGPGSLPLQGLTRVAVPGLTVPYVLDSRSAGTLYITDARLETFEENSGQTNTSTLRLEANGVFVVQRVGAIAKAVIGSQGTPPSMQVRLTVLGGGRSDADRAPSDRAGPLGVASIPWTVRHTCSA